MDERNGGKGPSKKQKRIFFGLLETSDGATDEADAEVAALMQDLTADAQKDDDYSLFI